MTWPILMPAEIEARVRTLAASGYKRDDLAGLFRLHPTVIDRILRGDQTVNRVLEFAEGCR